ncbi:low affinity immunoglobulin gamma Fc region receptor II-like isoform X2 [Pteronotus mesoamericanus]|uniref:low affinity immunoglobulin gamma Fc region receptor II-like isoform X2 n=1 Tax=Pteronotus mesoamericanus TaxID=1884717 RepID=UPI0023EDEA52|nr:low affinity immunoglobulin gamma Fc region receptor II-like isoform X2 [Pteronotus parnellii mesoamericanus]
MGVPSALRLPAAERARAGCPRCRPGGHLLLWAALLVLAPAAAAEAPGTPGPPKAVVHLEPPWFNVLHGDNVTLHCQGAHGPGNAPTQWFHDGIPVPTQVQPHYSFKASSNDSGDYQCQTGQTTLSDPVHLNVTSGWLLLQAPRLLFQEGEPITLRCHSWKSWRLYKITFFQDGKAKQFSSTNSNFSIPQANGTHSGAYHCTGFLGHMKYSSQALSVAVQVSSGSDSAFLVTVVVAAVVGVAALAAVAAVVAWVRLRRHKTSANLANTEEAANAEAENTITYSLLMHPEEDTTLADYQNA